MRFDIIKYINQLNEFKIGMNTYSVRKISLNGVDIATVDCNGIIIDDVQTALDLMMTVKYQAGVKLIAIPKDAFAEKFFVLSSGLAGEILQKFVNYQFKVAIYGDFSKYTSKPLKDFIYESNNGNAVFFTETQAQAGEKLSAAK